MAEASPLPTTKKEPSRIVRFLDHFAPAELAGATEDRWRQYRCGMGFIFASLLMTAVFVVANFKQGNVVAGWWEVGVFFMILTLPTLVRRTGKVVLFGNVCMFGGVSSIVLACWYSGGLDAPPMLILMIVPVWGYLGFGRRTSMAWSWISAGIVAFMFIAERKGWVPPPSGTPDKLQAKFFAEGLFTLGFAFLASSIFMNMKDYAVGMLQLRTVELKGMHDRLENLFGSMTQGVLTFDATGHIDATVSDRAQAIFGRDHLESVHVVELLFSGVSETTGLRESFEDFVELAFEAAPEDWSELVACAPEQLVRETEAGDQHLSLEFCPVRDPDGELERIMVLITDETERVQMESAAREQDEAHKRQVDELRRMVAGGAHLILQFLEVSTRRLTEVEEAMVEGGAVSSEQAALAMQHVHTVRGEARTFQLVELSERCAQLEELLVPMCATAAAPTPVPNAVGEHLAACRVLLTEARERLANLSPVGQAVLDQVTVRRSHVAKLADLVATTGGVAQEVMDAVQSLTSRPFGESTQRLPQAVAEWAGAMSKSVDVVVEGREESIPADLGAVLGGALGHLARNAVAHGIETPGERAAHGKPERATVRFECERVGQGVRISVSDDGRGLDEARLRSAAADSGLADDASLGDLLFAPGLSTAQDAGDVAGRGMGMAAVRTELARVGYTVDVATKVGRGTTVEIRPTEAPSALTQPRSSWRVA